MYFTVGLYADRRPGEIFVHSIEDCDPSICAFADAWAIGISMLLQSGWTIEELERKFSHIRFEPAGFTDNEDVQSCSSIVDYIIRWMKQQFGVKDEERHNEMRELQSTDRVHQVQWEGSSDRQ
jgi:ribonucleoside-diphosphate reductase alpha chain